MYFPEENVPCKFFFAKDGNQCRRGSGCVFSHNRSSIKPCKYYPLQNGCPRGDKCVFRHEEYIPKPGDWYIENKITGKAIPSYSAALHYEEMEQENLKKKIFVPFFSPLRKDFIPSILTKEERLRKAEASKKKGNELFKKREWLTAYEHYEKAIKVFSDEDTDPDSRNILFACHANAAQALLNLEKPIKAACHCTSVLLYDPYHVKALYRRAIACCMLGFPAFAMNDMTTLQQTGVSQSELDLLRDRIAREEVPDPSYILDPRSPEFFGTIILRSLSLNTTESLNYIQLMIDRIESGKGFPGDRESEGRQSGLWAAGLATRSMEGDVSKNNKVIGIALEAASCISLISTATVDPFLRVREVFTRTFDLEQNDIMEIKEVLQFAFATWDEPRKRAALNQLGDIGKSEFAVEPLLPSQRAKSERRRNTLWLKYFHDEVQAIQTARETEQPIRPAYDSTGELGGGRAIPFRHGDNDLGAEDIIKIHAIATAHGRQDIVNELEAFSSVNIGYNIGMAPLHVYVRAGKLLIVEFLLQRGVSAQHRGGARWYGRDSSPEYMCSEIKKEYTRNRMVELLRRYSTS